MNSPPGRAKRGQILRAQRVHVGPSEMGMRTDTKQRLLDAAEQLFARHGIGNTTVRMIVSEASSNVALISFHFGSLKGLRKAVLLRRFGPVVEERLEALAKLQARHHKPPAAIEILRAWMGPILRMASSRKPGERAFAQILTRTLIEPEPEYEELLRDQLEPHIQEFLRALHASLPELDSEEISNRFEFILGAVGHAMIVRQRKHGANENRRATNLLDQLMTFAEAGLAAPPAAKRK